MDRICGRCGLQQYTDRIREEYEKINNFDKSQTGQLMNRYRKITHSAKTAGTELKESQDITIVEQGLAFQLYR